MMKSLIITTSLLSGLLFLTYTSQAEMNAMADDEMEAISGKGIRIDANVDFAQDTQYTYDPVHVGLDHSPDPDIHPVAEYDDWSLSATDDTWIAYAQIIVDDKGNVLEDRNLDGYLDYDPSNIPPGKSGNIIKEDVFNGYNVVYKKESLAGDGTTSADYLIRKPHHIILGEISGGISFSGLELEFVGDFGADNKGAALKWTLPEEIVFNEFEVSGIYISEDQFISRDDNKLIGLRIDGPIYLPTTPDAYVFITSD